MEILLIKANEKIHVDKAAVACIGYFDGIHRGHQTLIDKTLKLADGRFIPAVICFDTDPYLLFHKVQDPTYITPMKERFRLLEANGIRRCYLLHFDESMMHMDHHTFIQQILNHLNLKAIVCGEDFHFAYQGKGNSDTLKNQSFELYVVPEKKYQGKKISSSTIEALIKNGDMENCHDQLGRSYSIRGKIIHGANVGGIQLGFPTANLKMEENYILPKKGVYSGEVCIHGQKHKAMINVGNNPTMNYQQNTSIEAHIIDFDDDIYDQTAIFYFDRYLREEKKFASKNELIKQLQYDVQSVKKQ